MTATPGNAKLTLSWAAPSSTGGAAISDYQVQYKASSSSTWSTFNDGVSASATASVTGLSNGTSYDVRVAAVNSAGTGVFSSTVAGTPATVASAPQSLTATPASGQVALSWAAPASNGGAPVSDYVIQYKLSPASTWSVFADGTSTVTATTVTGLTNGSGYDFQVAAVNSAGTGTYTATVQATPVVTATQPGAWSSTVTIAPALVSTLAGSSTRGTTDGTGAAAQFSSDLKGLHIAGGYGYVADGGLMRKVSLSGGQVSTVFGAAQDCVDSATPSAARMQWARQLTDDGTWLYWLDSCGSSSVTSLRRMNLSSGAVSTIGTISAVADNVSLTTGPGGVIYVGTGTSVQRANITAGTFTTIATVTAPSGMTSPIVRQLAADTSSLWAMVAGDCSGIVCSQLVSIAPSSGTVTAVTGTFRTEAEPGALNPFAPMVSAGSYLYAGTGLLADSSRPSTDPDSVIRVTKATGGWTVIAGATAAGFADGTGAHAWLNGILGIDTDGTSIYVSENGNSRIRKLTPGTALTSTQPGAWATTTALGPVTVTTLAGSDASGTTDGTGAAAQFDPYIKGFHVVGGFGYLRDGNLLRKVSLSTGQVTTVLTGGGGCASSTNTAIAGLTYATQLTDDGTFLYWWDNCPSASKSSLVRMDLSTSAVSVVTTVNKDVDRVSVTTGPGGLVYVGIGATVQRLDPVNATLTTIATVTAPSGMTSPALQQLAADGTLLWAIVTGTCSSQPCSQLVSITPASGTITPVGDVVSGPAPLQGGTGPIVSAGDYLYGPVSGQTKAYDPSSGSITTSSLFGIGRWTKSTGQLTLLRDPAGQPLFANGGQLDTIGIDVSGSSLYVTSGGTRRIYRLQYAAPLPPGGGNASGSDTGKEVTGGSNIAMITDCKRCEGFPVDLDTGDQFESATDIAIPGRGIPLAFTRTYDTRMAATTGPLGYGWTHAYDWQLTARAIDGTAASGSVTIRQDNGSQTTFLPAEGGGYTAPAKVLATLARNSDGSWTYTVRQTTKYTLNSQGKLTAITDLNGYATSLAYDGSARLSTVTDPAGRTLTLGYDGSNRISTVTDSTSRVITFTYDGSGNLASATNLAGGSWAYGYDASHRLTLMTDPRGHDVTTTYTSGKVTQQSDRRGKTTTYDYGTPASDGSHITTVTHPRGNKDTYTYTAGRVTSETKGATSSAASTTTYTYDPGTNAVTSITGNANQTTTFTVDARGNRLTATDPLNRTTTTTYNVFNEPLTVKDASNVTTTSTYDAAGRLLTVSRPLAGTSPAQTISSSYAYGDQTHPGDVTSATDANGKTTTFTYDTYGNQASVTDATGRKTTYTYTAAGWRTSEVSPDGNKSGGTPSAHTTTWSSFTPAGQPQAITNELGYTTTYGYDNNGNQTDLTDAENRHTTTTFDNEDHPLQVSIAGSPATVISVTAYDDNGNPATVADGLGHATTYTYDALDRLTSTADAVNNTTSYGYNAAGDQTTITDPLNHVTTAVYDAAGQAISSTGSPPTVTTPSAG